MGLAQKERKKPFSWSLAIPSKSHSGDPNFTLFLERTIGQSESLKIVDICWAGATKWRTVCVDEWRSESGFDEEIVSTLNGEYIYV